MNVLVALQPRIRYLPVVVGEDVVSVNRNSVTIVVHAINKVEAL